MGMHTGTPSVQPVEVTGVPLPGVGWQLSRENAIAAHMALVHDIERGTRRRDYVDNGSSGLGEAPMRGVPPPLESLRRVVVSELRLDEAMRGCALHGQLIVPPALCAGIYTLLEDSDGKLVKLALFNALPGGGSVLEREAAAGRLLPKKLRAAVREPFFKFFADGTYGVRVDGPDNLVRLER